jgi:hypothetical protein
MQHPLATEHYHHRLFCVRRPNHRHPRHELALSGGRPAGQPGGPTERQRQPQVGATQLPYGSGRYAAASLGNLGFTGQRKDTSPNLTYFNARYYDQDVGCFSRSIA